MYAYLIMLYNCNNVTDKFSLNKFVNFKFCFKALMQIIQNIVFETFLNKNNTKNKKKIG